MACSCLFRTTSIGTNGPGSASNAIDSRRPLYSQWFVQTNELPDAWSDRISEVADEDDNWFVVQVQRPYQGWLDHDLWTWLAERL